jgi:hypothetical protein
MDDKEYEILNLITKLASLCQNSNRAKEVAKILYREHRTHQQGIGRFIQESINVFAEMKDKNCFDPRNEQTCTMCKEMEDIVKEHNLPFI